MYAINKVGVCAEHLRKGLKYVHYVPFCEPDLTIQILRSSLVVHQLTVANQLDIHDTFPMVVPDSLHHLEEPSQLPGVSCRMWQFVPLSCQLGVFEYLSHPVGSWCMY